MTFPFSHMDAMRLGFAGATWLNVRGHQLRRNEWDQILRQAMSIVQQVRYSSWSGNEGRLTALVEEALEQCRYRGDDIPSGSDWSRACQALGPGVRIDDVWLLALEACLVASFYGRNTLFSTDISDAERYLSRW